MPHLMKEIRPKPADYRWSRAPRHGDGRLA